MRPPSQRHSVQSGRNHVEPFSLSVPLSRHMMLESAICKEMFVLCNLSASFIIRFSVQTAVTPTKKDSLKLGNNNQKGKIASAT